jgi:hypothetical protein
MSEPRFLKTSTGIFRVTVDEEIYKVPNTRAEVDKLISVGDNNMCVFIRTSSRSTKGFLYNVKTRDRDNIKIVDENTILMIKLAFTIVKEVSSHVKTLDIEESSVFTYELDNEGIDSKTFGISIALYELAFHQVTWYERHFNAKLRTEEANKAYLKAKEGFDTPKSENFDFHNKSLNRLLTPIYKNTKTWKEFFAEIYKIENKCEIMFPWYISALAYAMGGMSCSSQIRKIDIYNIPSIEYKEVTLDSLSDNTFMDYGEPDDVLKESLDYISRNDIYFIEYSLRTPI